MLIHFFCNMNVIFDVQLSGLYCVYREMIFQLTFTLSRHKEIVEMIDNLSRIEIRIFTNWFGNTYPRLWMQSR